MNKEEIWAKSRSQKEDEGILHAENKGLTLGYTIFYLLSIVIVLLNASYHQPIDVPLALMFVFCAAQMYTKYQFTKQKRYLLLLAVAVIFTIENLVQHILFLAH